MEIENPTIQPLKKGYKRALERFPDLGPKVAEFEKWVVAVHDWLDWIDENIQDNIYASRAEVLQDFHISPLGLEILERLDIDIYPEGRDTTRVEYDLKKLLRAVVCLPTVAQLTGKRLDRKGQKITTIFKEVIDDTLNGRSCLE